MATDQGLQIATAVINAFRERNALLLPDGALEKIGLVSSGQKPCTANTLSNCPTTPHALASLEGGRSPG
jgi:hypothetical protein